MVTFLITSFFILAFLAIAIYFWQKPAAGSEIHALMPPPPGRGLFSDGDFEQSSVRAERSGETATNVARQRTELLARSKAGEKAALQDTRAGTDPELYDEALNLHIAAADSAAHLLSLVSFVTSHELPVNKNLAERFIDSCKGRTGSDFYDKDAARCGACLMTPTHINALLKPRWSFGAKGVCLKCPPRSCALYSKVNSGYYLRPREAQAQVFS